MNFLLFDSFIPTIFFILQGPAVCPDSLAPSFFASLAVAEEVSQEMAAQQQSVLVQLPETVAKEANDDRVAAMPAFDP